MEHNDNSPRRVRLLTTVLLVGMFAAGVITGAAVLRWFGPQHRWHKWGGPLGPFTELNLSVAQKQQVEQVIEKHRPELEAVVRDTFPKMRAIHETIEKEVRAVLTPEQQKRLDAIKARRPPLGGHGPHFFGRHPGGPPDPFSGDHAPPPPPPPVGDEPR